MKKIFIIIFILIGFIAVIPASAANTQYSGYPTFSITAVVKDDTVSILGKNFPANDKFTVTMGAYGTLGIGGIVIETTDSGAGGVITKTYKIPASLKGSYKIAIRLQSSTTRYYAYNWFYNNSSGIATIPPIVPPVIPSGYSGYPTFSITAVVKDDTVSILGKNFPANDKFTVTMGAYGTLGIGGIVIETTDSGAGGVITQTYKIPTSLKGSYKIAIRLQSSNTGYYAYNWFYNNNAP